MHFEKGLGGRRIGLERIRHSFHWNIYIRQASKRDPRVLPPAVVHAPFVGPVSKEMLLPRARRG